MNVLLSGLLDAYGSFWEPHRGDRCSMDEGLALGVYLWGRIYGWIRGGATSGRNTTQGTFDACDAVKRWVEATKKALPIVAGIPMTTENAKINDCLVSAEKMLAGLTQDCEMLGWFRDTRRQYIANGNAAVAKALQS